jgi:hypothetical protein
VNVYIVGAVEKEEVPQRVLNEFAGLTVSVSEEPTKKVKVIEFGDMEIGSYYVRVSVVLGATRKDSLRRNLYDWLSRQPFSSELYLRFSSSLVQVYRGEV